MKNENKKSVVAATLTTMAEGMLKSSANSRCMFVFHQPKKPEDLKQFRKF